MAKFANFGSPLCDLAEPGQILVGADSHVRLERFFAFCERSPQQVKGKAEQLRVFQFLEPCKRPTATGHFAGRVAS